MLKLKYISGHYTEVTSEAINIGNPLSWNPSEEFEYRKGDNTVKYWETKEKKGHYI